MEHFSLKVIFSVVRNLSVATFFETPFIDWFVNGVFPTEGKTVPYTSRPVPTLAVKKMPREPDEENEEKKRDITVIEEDAPRLVGVVVQTEIAPRSKDILFIGTDSKELQKWE